MDASLRLEHLMTQIQENAPCPELAALATQLVPGHGNPSARIVFIGEAPGKKEDETGLPFQGAAGKFLNEMLTTAGIDRSDVYITNVVKYRPPHNRDPTQAEKEAFFPYLKEELAIINPQVVVTLGRHSMNYFLPDAVIGEAHGVPHTAVLGEEEVLLVPLYHPAAALYNGSLRQTLMDDFMRVAALIA